MDPPSYSFEEYRLYYESTEKVVDRRLANNTWNYGICSAAIVAIALLANWAVSRIEFRLVLIVAILLLAAMGMLLCTLWRSQIHDLKELNNAKFKVLNTMAPAVRFGPGDNRISARPFDQEWEILKAKETARELQTMRIVALRSSNAELLVPTAFRWLFGLISLAALLVIVVNWQTLTDGILNLNPPAKRASENAEPRQGG